MDPKVQNIEATRRTAAFCRSQNYSYEYLVEMVARTTMRMDQLQQKSKFKTHVIVTQLIIIFLMFYHFYGF